jgi:hypothetical protein
MYPEKKKSSRVISGKCGETPVWGSPILLVDDVLLRICYLGVHKLCQHVKVNTTHYCGFHEEK